MDKATWKELEERIDGEGQAPKAPEPEPAPPAAEVKPEGQPPETPAATPPAEPEASAKPEATATPPEAATPGEEKPPKKAAEPAAAKPPEPPRDEGGRFVKVSVHAREVTRRDTQIAELTRERDELKQKLGEAATGSQTAEQLQQQIAALEKTFGDKYPQEFKALVDTMRGVVGIAGQLEQSAKQAREVQETEAAAKVDEAIAANETLSSWQAAAFPEEGEATPEAKAIWQAAVRHDDALRASPAWANKPYAERFAEVVARTGRDFDIPIQPKPAAAPAASAKSETPPQPKSLPAAKPPASLSNVPGGIAPRDPRAGVDVTDPLALLSMTQGMDDRQVDEFLSKRFSA